MMESRREYIMKLGFDLLREMGRQARKAVQKGFLHLFSANCLTQLLGFGSLIIVTKLLTPSEVGALRIIQSYVSVCSTFAAFGLPSAIIKYCAEIRDDGLRAYILKHSLQTSLIVSLVIAGTVSLVANYGLISPDALVICWMPWYVLLILPSAAFSICLTYLQAIRQFKRMAKVQATLKLLSVVVVILLTWHDGIGGYIGAVVGMMIVSCFIAMRQVGVNFWRQTRQQIPIGFHFLARVSIFASVVGTLGSYADVFFLDHFVTDREMVGYYALATIFLMIGTQFTGTVQSFLTPYFAEKSYDGRWLWHEMMRYQRYLSLAMLAICPLIYLVVTGLVSFYYGNSYAPVLTFMVVMLLQLWLHTTYSIVGCTLLSINKVHYNLVVVLFYLMIKCILSYMMVIAYGVMGLVYAQVMAEIPAIAFEYYMARCAFKKSFGVNYR